MHSRFYNYANLLIDNIEGGYYSPERHYSSAMGISGETMFGMDRRHGGKDVTDSVPGKKFWEIVDKNSASWAYCSKGGSQEKTLKKLAAEIMYLRYEKYFKEYLTKKAQKKVSKNPHLEIHFFYGCWNGVVWFKKFAEAINNAVDKGVKDLETVAINSRKNSGNSLIAKGGEKMQKLFSMLKIKKGGKILLVCILLGGAGFGGYKLYNYLKATKGR